MNYQQTLDYLFAKLPMYYRIGASAYKANLDNTIKFCNLLGNPQNSFKSVHVAGTNGKGSVSHMLASILQEKGLKVGLYTSPHLKDFRERIRVNGMKIPKRYVSRFIHRHKEEFEQFQLSFFEMTVGLAFQFFKDEKVDIAIVEVGLGGRLDSTNIINPILSVITNISIDHIQFLGDTVEKIAMEKAGIIKSGIPVIIGETQDEVSNVFIEKAKSTGSEIFFADACYSAIRKPQHYDIHHSGIIFIRQLESPLLGNYQRKNIITVIGACEILTKTGTEIDKACIRKGIKNVIRNTELAGRWQILSLAPLTICDTGHNEGGLIEVIEQIKTTPHKRLHFVFGVVNDKQIDHILELLPKNATYYFCKAGIPRGLSQDELKRKGNVAGLTGKVYSSVREALRTAQINASADDLVFVGGSTFIVAEVI